MGGSAGPGTSTDITAQAQPASAPAADPASQSPAGTPVAPALADPASGATTVASIDPAAALPAAAAPANAPAPAAAPADVAAPAPAAAPAAVAVADPAPAPAAAPAPAPAPVAAASSGPVPTLGDCQLFPANAIFNTRIDDTSRFPALPQSDGWVALAGSNLPFLANWGFSDNPAADSYWGYPINIVDGTPATTDWPLVSFDFSTSGVNSTQGYPPKSDCAVPDANGFSIVQDCTKVPASQRHFPFPVASRLVNEGGTCNDPNSCGDHHVLVVEQGACRLWESFFAYNLSGQWYAYSTAAWNLNSLAMRPDDWASADAAGLPVTPLLVKQAEAASGEIRHAMVVGFRDAALSLQHVWPARFAAGADNPGAIPFGALLRLKADFVIPDNWTTEAKAVATAAKRYGLYVADNGADFSIGGEPNSKWTTQTYDNLHGISLSDMEFVDLKSITTDPRFSNDSMAASW